MLFGGGINVKLMDKVKGKAMQAAQRNFVEIAYCCYRYGFNQGIFDNEYLSFKDFCKNIKEVHLKGKKLWKG